MLRIKELEKLIKTARNDYYNGVSTISDQLYDAYIDELFSLDPKNPEVIGIGAEPVSVWERYNHISPMGSLNKAQTNEEYTNWHNKYIDDKVFATLKLDGLSVSLIYENGVLVKASTRGSGITGELITANVMKMDGVPLRLKDKSSITVRGEILLSKDNFNKYFAENYSNSRNCASGTARRFDGEGADKLSVLVYNVITDENLTTKQEQFEYLINYGFKTPPYSLFSNIEEVIAFREDYQKSLRDQYEFDLDGLVLSNNSLSKIEEFSEVDNRPKAEIAFKFDAAAKETTIKDIIIQLGNTGRITPVAVFDPPVNLMGADIERSTLHNFSIIEDLGVDIGCKVLVSRKNDVIPGVVETTVSTGTTFKPPTNCPCCNANLVFYGEYLTCPNTDGCSGQKAGRIKKWVSELNILELGETLIEKLCDNGLVNNPADLYKLTIDQMATIDRMGKKSAKNVYNSIWSNNPVNIELFLGGLSIPMAGSSTFKLLVDAGYDTLDRICGLSVDDLENIKGLGPVKALNIYNGLIKNKDIIDALLINGLKIKDKIIGKLSGKKVVFTGTMVNKRAILEKMVIDAGGNVGSGVSKDTAYLVIDDVNSTSSKAVNARKYGTALLSENQFLEMVKS